MFPTLSQEIHAQLFGQLGGGFGFSHTLERSGSYSFPTISDLEVTGNNITATVYGNVRGDIEVDGPADYNLIQVFGNVLGDVENFDGWYNTIVVNGHIRGDLEIDLTRGGSFSAWSVDDIWAYDSSGFSYNFGRVDNLDLDQVDDSNGQIGSLDDGYVSGDDNGVSIFQLEDYFAVDSGNNNSISIFAADGAQIEIDDDASNTHVTVQFGDVEVNDDGYNSQIRLGEGDDEVTVGQDTSGITMINGGAGYDVLQVEGGETVIVDNFEFIEMNGDGQNADIFTLDGQTAGTMWIGDTQVSLSDLMSVFGEDDRFGNAVLDWNGDGSFTAIGAAEQFSFPPAEDQWSMLG